MTIRSILLCSKKECHAYATNISALEASLHRAFHTNWDNQQPNLNLRNITNPSPAKLLWKNLFGQTGVMGKATFVAALVLGYFVIAIFFGIQTPISSDKTATILPTPNESAFGYATSPTPSAQISLTGSTSQACETISYRVQENDTIESIAFHHGITINAILEYNNLISTTISIGAELIIPLCQITPSHTAPILENMITITPVNGTIFPTQPQ
jgi:LysM repeat protein